MEKIKLLGISIYMTILFCIDYFLWTTLEPHILNLHGFVGFNILGVLIHLIALDIYLIIKIAKTKKIVDKTNF